jgi:hypothetical protein
MDTTTSLKILSPSQSALDSKPNTSELEGLDVKEAWHNFLDWYNNVKEIFFSFFLFLLFHDPCDLKFMLFRILHSAWGHIAFYCVTITRIASI